MIRHRIPRAVASLVVAASMSAGSAALPIAALAGQPNWSMAVTPLPDMIRNGDTGAYLVEVTNNGPSNISKLFLNADTPAGASFVAAVPSTGSCAASGPLSCSLGALRKHRTVTLLAIYQAPPSGDGMTVNFEATTGGATSNDKGGNSQGDALVRQGSLALTSDPSYAGRFIFEESQLTVANDQQIGEGNQHATKVVAPETFIPVTVEDNDSGAGCEQEELPCFGQTSEIHVNGGASYPNGFLVTIIFGAGELPNSAPQEFAYYEYDPSGPPDYEPFTADDLHIWHQFDNGSGEDIPRCGEGVELPCFTAMDLEDGSIQANIWLTENGKIQGW